MAQEPSSRELLEAVKQQESGGRRYKADGKTLLEGPQTKYGTAKGEMQVLDMTNKDPGFGVKPARDDSPDERARVGQDYLAAMVKKYGDRETALVAYNWGPGNTDKWLKAGADPAKLPKETQNYVAKVTASLGGTKVSPTKVAAGPKANVPPRKTGIGLSQAQLFSQLGPSYQAAIAVSMLADEAEKEGKDEDAPSESEKMLAAMPSKPAVVDLDLGYQSPFPEVQAQAAPVTRKQVSFLRPVRMAAGGLPFAPTASVRPSVRAELDAIKAEYDVYAPKAEEYNKALEKYNADVYKPYQAQVDAYNADLEKYKAEQLAPYQEQIDAYNAALNKYNAEQFNAYQAQIDAYNAALNKYKTETYDPYQAQIDAYNTALGKYKTDVYDPYEAAQKKYDAEYAAVFATPKPVSFVMSNQYRDLMARAPVAPAEFSMAAPVAPAEFSMAAPVAPAEFSMAAPVAPAQFSGVAPTKPAEFAQKAPTVPAVSQEDYAARMAAAKADAGRRQVALSAAMDPQAYGLSINKLFAEGGEVSAPYGGPVYRAKGSPETGEVGYFQDPMGAPSAPITEDTFAKGKDFRAADALKLAKEFGTALGSNTESLVRGAVAQIPGAVGDLESLARMGINFSFGPGGVKVGEKTIAPTSEEIRARVPRITAPRPESSGMESMGEMMAPGLGKAALPVAKAAAKGTAKEMLRGIEGEGVLAPISPQDAVMYAVKPRGGTSLTSGSIDKPSISKIDKTIENWFERTVRDAPDAETTKTIRDFLDKKGRKYLTDELGTGSDPIRTAMASGEIQPYGNDAGRFPEYLLHAARTPEAPGHLAAKKDLENLYDRASAVEGRVVGMHDPADADARRRFDDLVRQSVTNARATMAQEGVPQELQNPAIQGIAGNDLDASYNAQLRNAIGAPQEFPAIAGAVERGQPIYDLGYQTTYMDMFSPKYVAENINTIPPNKLKNMSFADAMIEGSKRMEVSRNYDKAIDLVAKGANVPKEVLFRYTKPITETNNGQWVQLTDKMATKMEGKMLHHSVGGYAESSTYGHGGKTGFDTGVANVFSLRDPKTGLAKTTLEAKKLKDGSLMFSQHKGNFNSFPEKDVKDIFTLFDKLGKDKPVSLSEYEMYPNDPTGTPLPRPIKFNWGKAYQEWKDTGKLPPIPSAFGDTLPPPPSQINIPFAKGGMVERQVSTARYI